MLHPFPISAIPHHTHSSLSFHAAQPGIGTILSWQEEIPRSEYPPVSLLLHPGDLPWSLLSLVNVHGIHEFPGSISGPSSGLPPQALLLLDLLLCLSTSCASQILKQVKDVGLLTSDATASSMAPHTKQLLNTTCMGGGMSPALLQILLTSGPPCLFPWDPADFSALICSK